MLLSLHLWPEILKYFDWAKRVHASLLPITGISLRWRSRFAVEQTNTISASANSSPLSLWTSMPSTVRWLKMAPAITPMARSDPRHVNRGVRIRIAASSSTTPDPMRPHGSAPTFGKRETDSGAAVNLKKRVCSRMIAAVILRTQLRTVIVTVVFIFIASLMDLILEFVVGR